MLPTPGTRSIKLEMTMKMKNVVANGKTQRVTRLSKISPIKPSQPSTIASSTFCIPDGTSLMFFQVETRTTIRMSAATIQVQIIELVIGNPPTLKTSSAAEGTFDSAGAAFTFAAKTAKRNAQTKMILLNCFTVKNYF